MPGATPRKAAKAMDSGLLMEDIVTKMLNDYADIEAWRLPGVRIKRPNGINCIPDAAGWIPELEGRVPECTPEVKGRPTYNLLVEIKHQETSGSASVKIQAAIRDMAHNSDVKGVPGVVLLNLPALTEREVKFLKAYGRMHSVVVLEAAEMADDPDLLLQEIMRVVRERRRLVRRIGPLGAYHPSKRPSSCEKGLAARVETRRINGTVLRQRDYGLCR